MSSLLLVPLDDLVVFPNMNVTIPVDTAENVVKLPNAALRFKPPLSPEEVRALYAKYGIESEPADKGSGAPAGGRREARAERAVIWQLRADGTIEPVEVALGITDHAYTEVRKVLRGAVRPGDEVVTSAITSKSGPPGVQGVRR